MLVPCLHLKEKRVCVENAWFTLILTRLVFSGKFYITWKEPLNHATCKLTYCTTDFAKTVNVVGIVYVFIINIHVHFMKMYKTFSLLCALNAYNMYASFSPV